MQAETAKALAAGGTSIPSLRVRVEHLSGGQRQAIELNRFVHWGGKLVMLDEPFAALGVEQTRRGLEMVERVARAGHRRHHDHPRHGAGVSGRRPDRRAPPWAVAGDVATGATSADEVVRMITGDIGRTPEPENEYGSREERMKILSCILKGALAGIAVAASLGVAVAQELKGKIYYLVPTLLDEFQTGSIDAITKFMKDVGYEVVSLDGRTSRRPS